MLAIKIARGRPEIVGNAHEAKATARRGVRPTVPPVVSLHPSPHGPRRD